MARPLTVHRCEQCRAVAQRWAGRCPACGAWNSLVPWKADEGRRGPAPAGEGPEVVALAAVDPEGGLPVPTGVAEMDRVLSGGLVPGSLTLLFGEPGIGKSTLLAQVLSTVARRGRRALLVSAEESAAQVRARAERLGPLPASLLLLVTTDVATVGAAVAEHLPDVVVVDSVQTVSSAGAPGAPGSPSQVRACAEHLREVAKGQGPAVVLVGHVTKEGAMAGPRALEHLVDTVIALEGDRHHSLRALRALKHRFGATGEVGLLELGETGLADVEDPGRLLLGDRLPHVPGGAVGALLHGRRPLLVELQALACTGGPAGPRVTAQGVDARRLATVLAVLESRAEVEAGRGELFVSAAGGIRAAEPAADLPIALAVASALAGVALPPDLVSFGEIGLAGELRQVLGGPSRLEEAARLGFAHAVVPSHTPGGASGLEVVRARTLPEAIAAVRQLVSRRPAGPALVPGTMPTWPNGAANR